MSPQTLSDADLVAAARDARDLPAFAELVNRYHRLVFGVAVSVANDRTLAEDATQETFLHAWEHLAQLRDPDRVGLWLCGIARNVARAAHRKRARELPNEDAEVASDASPLRELMARDADRALADLLGRVPRRYRAPMVLHYAADMPVARIAECLGLSQPNVKKLLSRGRELLRDRASRDSDLANACRAPATLAVAIIATVGARSAAAHAATTTGAITALASGVIVKKNAAIIVAVLVACASSYVVIQARHRANQRQARSTALATATGSAQHAASASDPSVPATLVVSVADAKGPLPGATVRFERDRGDVEIVQTGSDGVARAGALEPGTWEISASADGHEPAASAARELHAGEVVDVKVVLGVGGRSLTGTVTDASGGPISGARIDAAKLGGMVRRSNAVASTLSNADGKYKLTVAEGQLMVAASDASYAPQSRLVEVGASGATADFQLVPGGVIEGVVRDDKTHDPVPGAVVRARRDSPAMLLGERAIHVAKASTDGRFRITGLRPGAYELGARAPSRASSSPTIVGLGVAEQVADVEILIGAAPVIRGVVVDEAGAPTPDAEVWASGGDEDEATISDAKGAFVIEGLGAGHYTLRAHSNQFLQGGPTAVDLAHKDIDGVKVRVRRGQRITGRVERPQVCDVRADFEETVADMPMFIAPTATGPDGKFDIGPVQPVAYALSARCTSGEQGTKRVDARAALGDVVIEVKPGASIAGNVVDGAGKPVAGVAVMAAPSGGTERTTIINGVVMSGVQGLTNAAGAFELRGLAAGGYRLRVLDRGRPLPTKSETKLALSAVEKKTGVKLAIDRPDGVIRGVVVDSSDKPIADAWVSVHQDVHDMLGEAAEARGEEGGSRMVMVETRDDGGDSGDMPPALTDANGKFELENLSRVPWTVVAEARAGKLRARATKIVPDADIKVQAMGLTALNGKVIAPGGMPSSFQVELEGPTRAQRSFASPDGTFSFARVDPGDYTVSVTSAAGNGRGTVRVIADQAAHIEVTLAANAIVVGKLIDATGKPLGGIPMTIVPDAGDGRMRVELQGPPPTSNADGTFRLQAKAGPSALVVMTQPRPTSKRGLNLEAGKTLDVGPVTVEAGPPPP